MIISQARGDFLTHFEQKWNASTLQGFTLLIGGLVSSTSGIITGALADLTGDYTFGYIIYGVVALVGAAIAIFGVGIPCARRYKGEIAKANSKTI